jgi:diketogulonate reductase-like aldo/keto reductase
MEITNLVQVTVTWLLTDNSQQYTGISQFSPEEYEAMTPEDLVTIQTEQYNYWLSNQG